MPGIINPDGRGFLEEATPKTWNAKGRLKVRDEGHATKFPKVPGSHQAGDSLTAPAICPQDRSSWSEGIGVMA